MFLLVTKIFEDLIILDFNLYVKCPEHIDLIA
jgi:hypothetical protein